MVHTWSSRLSSLQVTYIYDYACNKIKKKFATLNRHTESIKHKSLTNSPLWLVFIWELWNSLNLYALFAYGGGPAELCLWSPGVCALRGNCWQHKHATSCSATWRSPALSRLQHRWCLSLDGERLCQLATCLLFELYGQCFSFVAILKRILVARD